MDSWRGDGCPSTEYSLYHIFYHISWQLVRVSILKRVWEYGNNWNLIKKFESLVGGGQLERGWMSVHWIFTPPRTTSSFFGSCHQLPKIGTRGEPFSPYLFIGTIIGEYLFIIEEYNIFVFVKWTFTPESNPPTNQMFWFGSSVGHKHKLCYFDTFLLFVGWSSKKKALKFIAGSVGKLVMWCWEVRKYMRGRNIEMHGAGPSYVVGWGSYLWGLWDTSPQEYPTHS